MEEIKWYPISQPPLKPGWYLVKLKGDSTHFEAPYVHTAGGKLTWVVPNDNIEWWAPKQRINKSF